MIRSVIKGLFDLLYPPQCLLCKDLARRRFPYPGVCLDCYGKIALNHPPFCIHCSRFLGKKLTHPKCVSCREHNPDFDFAWGACLYSQQTKTLIYSYKYYHRTYLRHVFTALIHNFISRYELDISQFDALIPVPLFASRLRERGFNQSLLLAQGLSKVYNIPIYSNNLIRIKNTKSQAFLSKKDRWTNTNRAFKIKRSYMVENKSVLIIDDLLTTGATASSAAFTLKNAGAKRVGVLTLAVTVSNFKEKLSTGSGLSNQEYIFS